MADLIAGYAPKVTVTGNSLYWARGEYDPQYMGEMTSSHYISNQNATNTKQISVNDGLQADGSWKMTVANASGWSTNDRAIPSYNSSYASYTTTDLAFAGASNGDRIIVVYSGTTGEKRIGPLASGASTTKAVSMIGAIPNLVWKAPLNSAHYLPNGDFTGVAQLLIRNFIVNGGNGTGYYSFNFGDSSKSGGGIRFDRCRFFGLCNAIATTGVINGGVVVANCLFVGCFCGTVITEGTGHSIYNCTFIDCQLGVDMYVAMNISNTVTLNCDVPYNTPKTVTGSKNGSDNSTAPGTNPVTLTRSSLKLMQEISGGFSEDARPQPTSSMYHAGVAVSGVTHDIDGNAWTNPPSVGCSNGPVFLEVIPAAGDIKKDVVATDVYGTNTTGTYEVDPDTIIHSAGGNWIDEQVTANTLLSGATAGVANAIIGEAVVATESEESNTAVAQAITANHATASQVITGESIQVDGNIINGEAEGGGSPGTNYCEMFATDENGLHKGGFQRGETVYADCWIEFNATLTDATVTLKLYDADVGLVATLINGATFSFTENTGYDMIDINGSYPGHEFVANNPVGNYYLELVVLHSDLGHGRAEAYTDLALMDLPEVSNVVAPDTVQDVTGTAVTGGGQAAAPTGLGINSSGDGLTHTLTVTCSEVGATFELHNGSNIAVAGFKNGEKIRGLTQGAMYHCHALATNKTISAASPTEEAEAIAPNYAPAATKILVNNSARVDGQLVNGTFDEATRNVGCDPDELVAGTIIKIQNIEIEGTNAGEADPDTVVSTAGGNWNVGQVNSETLIRGAVAGVNDAIKGTVLPIPHVTRRPQPVATTKHTVDVEVVNGN